MRSQNQSTINSLELCGVVEQDEKSIEKRVGCVDGDTTKRLSL